MNDISLKLLDWFSQTQDKPFIYNNINLEKWLTIQNKFIIESKALNDFHHIFILAQDQFKARELFHNFKSLKGKRELVLFEGPETNPFEEHVHSEQKINSYLESLNKISLDIPCLIFTDFSTLTHKLPPKEELKKSTVELRIDESFSQQKLKSILIDYGFQEREVSKEPLTFSIRGEIFDIALSYDEIYRLNYFDDYIEHIFKIDAETYKANREEKLQKINLSPNFRSFFRKEFVQNLRTNIQKPSPHFKTKNECRNKIFETISNSNIPENSFHLLPFFFENTENIFDYLVNPKVNKKPLFIVENFQNSLRNIEIYKDNLNESFNLQVNDPQSRNLLPSPSNFLNLNIFENFPQTHIQINSFNIGLDKEETLQDTIELEDVDIYKFLGLQKSITSNSLLLQALIKFLQEKYESVSEIKYCSGVEHKKFLNILTTYEIPTSRVNFQSNILQDSFYSLIDNTLYLSGLELFGRVKKKTRKKKSQNYFAEQISTLRNGDYLVHKKHGVGVFCGIQTLNSNDYLVIEYKDKDKVYVPVYNLDLVQKYADSGAECKVADLKSKKFEKSKSQARKAIKELAFSVLKLQAEREAFQGFSFSPPGEDYEQFSQKFPYTLTDDQHTAVESIIEDMCSQKPMDRLVCGDVGFGKTEVAMRAAFKAVEDDKQVALLVPTTILALQHFMNFKERFKDFPVQIDYVSRFIGVKKTREIFERIETGKSDILIGTHKILSSKLEFSNLGLVIIDEEHRFGVAQKEKLKLLKKNIDFLTLTATPIPRTLQLSFLGIKELSLIQTPPPKRQSISTYMVRENDKTLKNAIESELARKGQVFVIHNRVQDIEIVSSKIRALVPQAKITFAHGQMPEKELETKIQDFYSGKFDILIATTIVESGIDIPTANTMIINNSHAFGLAQLHQLRGRIGRSTRKAFCYFLIPDNKQLSATASKRLEALQRYSSIGGGFALANSDLEIRGAGNVLGGEQSGHIQSIGLELYSEMLKEAISEIKGETQDTLKSDIDIKVFFPTLIPNSYIKDQNNRLKYYKIISNSQKEEQLDQLCEELQDIFGKIPEEVHNLISLIKMRNLAKNYPFTSIQFSETKIILKIDKKSLAENESMRNHLVTTTLHRTNLFKIKPNQSILCHYKQVNSTQAYENLKDIISIVFP